ncbi:unnamed protein product, partial [Ixodes persulcatus]
FFTSVSFVYVNSMATLTLVFQLGLADGDGEHRPARAPLGDGRPERLRSRGARAVPQRHLLGPHRGAVLGVRRTGRGLRQAGTPRVRAGPGPGAGTLRRAGPGFLDQPTRRMVNPRHEVPQATQAVHHHRLHLPPRRSTGPGAASLLLAFLTIAATCKLSGVPKRGHSPRTKMRDSAPEKNAILDRR